MTNRLNVAILANLKKNAPRWSDRFRDGQHEQTTIQPPDVWGDLDAEKTVHALMAAFNSRGYKAYFLEGDVALVSQLTRLRPDICYNLCEGHFGDSRESQVPALLEMMGIPYVGSKVLTHAVSLNKALTKRVLQSHGLPTAPFQLFRSADEPLARYLTYPLFVKPNSEGTGMGIDGGAIVQSESQLRSRLHYIISVYRQPALVEPFIDGREFTVGVIGNAGAEPLRFPWKTQQGIDIDGLHVFPPMEIDLSTLPPEESGLYSHHVKDVLLWTPRYLCPAPIDAKIRARLQKLVAATFTALECYDISRIDFRIDRTNGRPYILEINTLPGMTPVSGDIVMSAEADGMDHATLVNSVLDLACARFHLKPREYKSARQSYSRSNRLTLRVPNLESAGVVA